MSRLSCVLFSTFIFNIFIFLVIFIGDGGDAWSYPDTFRRGYSNCSSCHVSPSGGGLLTLYGRDMSKEMSTWSYKNEEGVLHGALGAPDEEKIEQYALGADVRHLHMWHLEETNGKRPAKASESFWMQAQLRAAIFIDRLKFVMSLGQINSTRTRSQYRWYSPEYYVLWNIKDDLHIRWGRFEPVYGLRMPDHNLWVKTEIAWVPWNQRDAVEMIAENDKYSVSIAGYQSTSSVPVVRQKTGYSFGLQRVFLQKQKVGVHTFNSEGQGERSRGATLTAHLSPRNDTYMMMEWTRAWKRKIWQDLGFVRFGYEVWKGFVPMLQGQVNLTRDADQLYKYGIGLQWLPRPHLELLSMIEHQGQFKKQSLEYLDKSKTDVWLMLHYYF